MENKTCVVIGAGMSGLSTAAILARKGVKVTVLEANAELVGGLAALVKVGDGSCSFGPRYLWNFGEGNFGDRFLAALGIKKQVKLLKLNESGFEHVYHSRRKDKLVLPMSISGYTSLLKKNFPTEADNIDAFFQDCYKSHEVGRFLISKNYQFVSRFISLPAIVRQFWWRPSVYITFFLRYRSSLGSIMDKHKLSRELQDILNAHSLIFNEHDDDLSFHTYAHITLSYLEGSYFPEGGMKSIINPMIEVIQKAGGEIVNGERVIRAHLKFDNGKEIHSIETAEGNIYQADIFISSIDPNHLNNILKESDGAAVNAIPKYKYGPSGFAVFLELNDTCDISGSFGRHNIVYCIADEDRKEIDPDLGTRPPKHIYINSPSMSYGESADTGKNYISFIFGTSHAPELRQVSPEKVEKFTIKLLKNSILQNLRPEHILSTKTFGPKEIQSTFNTENGNIYGKSMSSKDIFQRIPVETKYNNLLQVGHFIAYAGVVSCMQSAAEINFRLFGEKI